MTAFSACLEHLGYLDSKTDAARHLGSCTERILRNARVADLPVLQPTIFELAVNLKTAGALGLEIPPSVMLMATEIIE